MSTSKPARAQSKKHSENLTTPSNVNYQHQATLRLKLQ
jgi:hypothetical protein